MGSGWKKSGVPREQIFVSSLPCYLDCNSMADYAIDNEQIMEYSPSPRKRGGGTRQDIERPSNGLPGSVPCAQSPSQISHLSAHLQMQMHWPVAFEHTNETLTPIDPVTKRFRLADVSVEDTWAAMEKLVKKGKIRSIGVSNFTVETLEKLLKSAEIPPTCNQIEAHPYLQQPKLFNFMKEKGILPVAYSPLGNNIYGAPRYVHSCY